MLGAHRSDANLAEAFVVTRFDDKKIGHAPVCADDGSYFQQVWNIRQKVLRRGSLSEDQAVPVDVSMEEFEDSVICNARTYSPLLGVLGEYDPIVDICVIFPNQNEKIPAGYECLIRTPFGHRGDCNSGVVGGEGVFICVKRSSRPSPHFKDNSSVIVDIKVVFMDKEAVPKGYDLIKTSRSGAFSANLNYGYLGETIYLAVKRCPVETLAAERYHSLRPIVGVCIINQTKGETVPVGFEMIDKSTSHGNWTGNKMYICIRRGSGYGMLDNMFAATLSDRVPKMDDEDFSLPQGVELFTAPTGIQLKRREVTNVPLPEFFSLVLTLEDGSPLYISCFTFYEMLEDDVVQELETHYDSFLFGLARSNKDPRIQRQIEASISCGRAKMNGKGNVEFFSLTEQPLKTPKADPNYGIYSQVKISIVSRFPFYREYKQFLMLLYQVSISRTTLPLERYVGHFLFELPLPKPGKPGFALGFGGGDMREIQFSLPPRQGLGFCSINFETVFRCLDFERFIDLYCLLLLERRVVVHSSHLSVLNEVMEGMRILMFPLDWQSTYIPVCPAALWENITAPVPFFIGLETRTLVDRSTQLPTDVWEVSLDENKIYYWDRLDMTTPVPEASLLKRPPGAAGIEPLATVRSGIQAPKPPIALLTPFKRDLKNAVFDSAPTLKTELGKGGEKLFGQSEPDMAYSLSPLEASGAEAITSLQESVRLCCVRLIVELIGHYQDFLLPPKHTRAGLARPETSPTNLPNIFNVSGFLEACPKTLRPFVSEITTTLSFTNFIDERTFSTQAGFGFVFFDKLIAELRTSPTARSTTFGWGKALGSAPSESERTLKRPSSFSVLGASSKQSFTNSKGQTFSTSFTGMIKSMSTRKSASSKSSGNITPEEEKKGDQRWG
uniref:UDENN domain-containing protein n=1 Tax=Mucochytrium quahogii TaxID=96639 RepID=A0A7S2RED2_9STRA|mmetsp:Transcript_13818/g.29983  ORF Transcript_13818/g.29983 Transcript_13818/m.29983 type:complete len:896 (+) Transcript_13818:937-3624(+)